MGDRGDGAHGQWGTWAMGHMDIIMHRSRWGTGVMGHMGNGAHGQWGTWAIATLLTIAPLILDGFLQKFNWR